MSNKLPWFTHDHDARNDDFIRRAEDRFGHFGYAGYFKMIEILHEHGTGDRLKITKSRLSQELRSRWPQVRLLLDFCRTSGKVEFTSSQTEVELQIKKFRERQQKMKSNLPSTFRQPSVNLPLEGEGEKEGQDKQRTVVKDFKDLKTLISATAQKREDAFREVRLLGMQMPFGEWRGVQVVNLEPSYCAFLLAGSDERMGPELRAALTLRVKIKAEETIR